MIFETILQAIFAIKGSSLRAILTMLIIGFGIMAIVGVLTAIDGIRFWMQNSFSTLGANTLKIENKQTAIRMGGGRRPPDEIYPAITWLQAQKFKDKMEQHNTDVIVSNKLLGSMSAIFRYQNFKTNQNIALSGVDENILTVESYTIEKGRNINITDIKNRANVAVIGYEIKKRLFPYSNPIGKQIFNEGNYYTIIGLLSERGTSFGSAGDKVCFIPITTLLKNYRPPISSQFMGNIASQKLSFTINVYTQDAQKLTFLAEECKGIFRIIRKLRPNQSDNFAVSLSDTFVNNLLSNLRILTLSATFIAIITLFGASIGLMNIMLVSVTERTMEIGLRMALGATRGQIRLQFLTEAIIICQFGGIIGSILGIFWGNAIGLYLGTSFVIPWLWIMLAFLVCFVVGVLSGLYPALKAAKLDPIETLRYE